MSATLTARPASDADFDGAEPLLERLAQPGPALENLTRLASVDEERLGAEGGWAARVALDDTEVLLRGDGEHWTIFLPRGADDADAMLTARRLHGLLGEQSEGWDADR